jgi:diguanylate cyclase (GGDEF)-like protein
MRVDDTSWLCPTPSHRERFVDMQVRLRTARLLTMSAFCAAAVTLMPTTGWPLLALCIAMVIVLALGSLGLARRRRPELWVFSSTVVNLQLALATAVVLTGGPRSVLGPLLAIPVLMVAARFSNRGLVVGAPVSAVLIVATTLGVDPAYVFAHPATLAVPLLLVLGIASYVSPLVASDVRHRADSTLDQLTGLLNRRAFEPRFAEVTAQAELTRQPVSVAIGDIDHFKQINDVHGHAVGDAVLRDVAYAMRSSLRTFELLYRLGGEEFLLLLPGADAETAIRLAETLRAAIEDLSPGGIDVTCSFGVATADAARGFGRVIEDADAALYAAKRDGRNRVESSSPRLLA